MQRKWGIAVSCKKLKTDKITTDGKRLAEMAKTVEINYEGNNSKKGRERAFSCLFLRTCGSTQEEALVRLEKGSLTPPFAVIAKGQKQGRGRGQRGFLSPYNKGVYLTAVLDAQNFSNTSLFGALCVLPVAKTVEEITTLKAEIKWPNDLLIKGQKFCGILPQNKAASAKGQKVKNYLLMGIGININTDEKELAALDIKATSLYLQGGKKLNIKAFTLSLLRNLFNFALNFDETLEENTSRYLSNCVSAGKKVRYLTGEEIKEGKIVLINNNLSITVKNSSGERQTIFWGEVMQDA